jgi:hypothetical protein
MTASDASHHAVATPLGLLALLSSFAAILAAALIWLMLTNPVATADAFGPGGVAALLKGLTGVVLASLRALLRFL